MPEEIILTWDIMTFDKRKPNPFPLENKSWFLNWDKVSAEERAEILLIINGREDDPLPPDLNPLETEQITLSFSKPDMDRDPSTSSG
jgi:hypothetical protein